MTISTVSFDKAKIYKNKMIFTKYGVNSTSTQLFDSFGRNIVNRISYNPIRTIENDKLVIMKKKEYETQNKSVCFELIKRIYDKTGHLLEIKREIYKH